MRLIDADKLKQDVLDWENCYNGYSDTYDKSRIIGEIDEQPTIDAEPVRHGKWIWDDEGYHCSECWYHAQGNTMECMDGTFRFCPVCGARMDLDEVEKCTSHQ